MIFQHKEVSMKKKVFVTTVAIFMIIIASIPLEAATLNLGHGEGSPGGKATMPLTLSQGSGIVAASADIYYDTSILKNPKAKIGDAAKSGKKQIHTSIPGQGVFRMSEGGFILLHDLDGEGALIPTDFLMAVRGEILRDLTEEEKKSKITPIGVNKEGKRKIRCTVVYLHDSFNFCVSETPEEIYELLSETSYEATYEAEEADDDDADIDEDDADD